MRTDSFPGADHIVAARPGSLDHASPDLKPSEFTCPVTALAPNIAAHTDETRSLRRINDPVCWALLESEHFMHFVPKAFGGMAKNLDSLSDVTLPIAETCA
ncbi:hypothetical protein [Roseomonas sp. WA12]